MSGKSLAAIVLCALALGLGSSAAASTSASPSSPFLVTRVGDTYQAVSQSTTSRYSGTLKYVVESAVKELKLGGGGTVTFAAGDFDLGTDFLLLSKVTDVLFEGQGMDVTTLRNATNAAADTEPFNMHNVTRLTIRDMTVVAGGSTRTTSDALDFDGGNENVVERVKVTASRGRAIVFDGKDYTRTADGNVIRDCVISGAATDGIVFLASSRNLVERCTITDIARHGIQATKASASAGQPNKKSSDNVLRDNVIDNVGYDGINVNSGDRNVIAGNRITNSGNIGSGSGIKIGSADSITCDDNAVDGNVATDTQATKTQRYGLYISSSLCNRTVVASNDFSGNRVKPIYDKGTGTVFVVGADTSPPTTPTNAAATAISSSRIDVSWAASTDNVGVDHYAIKRNGQFLASVAGSTTSYSDTGAQPSTTYVYAIEAFDAAGNGSGDSAPASATTPTAPGPGTTIVTPVADTYVNETSPTTNYGSLAQLRVDGSPFIRSFLRFSVQGLSGTVTKATLRVYANSSSSAGHSVFTVADNTWTESGTTFSNQPGLGTQLGSWAPVAAATWTQVDVTPYITGNGTYSLALTTAGTTAISYASREASNRPELVIETT